MGKSKNTDKYGKYRQFGNKKQKQKSGHSVHNPIPKEDEFGGVPIKDWDSWQNT